MTKLNLLLFGFLLFFASFIPSNDRVRIKIMLHKGETFDYKMNMDMKVDGKMKEEPIKISVKLEMEMRLAVDDVNKDGNYEITYSLLSAKGNFNLPKSNSMKFDSRDTKDKVSSQIGEGLKKLVFQATMRPDGSMADFNMNRFFDSISAIAGSQGVGSIGMMHQKFDSIMHSPAMKKSFENRPYPNHELTVGDTWSPKIPENPGTTGTVNITNTINAITDKNIEIGTLGDIAMKRTLPQTGEIEMKGKFTGTKKLDRKSCMPLDNKMKMDMDVSMYMQGAPTKMKMDVDMQIKKM